MSLLVRDGVSTEQLSSRDGRRQRARSKIEERSSMFAATWELAVLCTAQQPPVARAHAFASSRVAKTPGGATAPGAKEANEPLRWPPVVWTCRATQLHCSLEVWMDGGTQNEGLE